MSGTPERHKKTVSEVRNVSIDMRGKLDYGELLASSPTITEEVTADLTISNEQVSTTALVINGRTVPTGQAVQFQVAGGVAERQYSIRVLVTTDATPPQTLVENVALAVMED